MAPVEGGAAVGVAALPEWRMPGADRLLQISSDQRKEMIMKSETIRRRTAIGSAAFVFMCARPLYSNPPIASGRFTRGRLACYWLDGFVLVPSDLGGVKIPENEPW